MRRLLLFILISGLLTSWCFLRYCPNLSEYIISILTAIGTIGACIIALWEKPKVICKIIKKEKVIIAGKKCKKFIISIYNNTPEALIIHQIFTVGYSQVWENESAKEEWIAKNFADKNNNPASPIYPYFHKRIEFIFTKDEKIRIPTNDIVESSEYFNFLQRVFNKLFCMGIIVIATNITGIRIRINCFGI